MQQQYSSQQIPTIRQVHRDLKQSYLELDQVFKDIGILPLPLDDDLEYKKITLKQVLDRLPTEEQLQAKLSNATTVGAKDCITKYSGTNQLVLKAKQNYNEIKSEQRKIYYLAAEYSKATVSPEFKQKSIVNLKELHSFQDVTEVKKTKVKALQKNTISDIYFEDGQAELDIKQQPVVKCSKKTQQLKYLDLLVHVNFYDSHNSQKQFQFVCVEEQNLSSLVEKFKCLIDTISNIGKLRKKPQKDMENYEIYDKFYQPPPQRITTKGHPTLKIEPNPPSQNLTLKYLIIEDVIYYEGNKKDLEPLLNASYNKNKIQYRCIEIKKTKLSDIRAIFGKAYLYRHLQGCDHIIIFKQARLYMGNDDFNYDILQVEKYPLTVYESKMKRRKCEACVQYFADFATIGDPLKNGQNLYLCQNCHKDLHYNDEDKPKFGLKQKFIGYIHD